MTGSNLIWYRSTGTQLPGAPHVFLPFLLSHCRVPCTGISCSWVGHQFHRVDCFQVLSLFLLTCLSPAERNRRFQWHTSLSPTQPSSVLVLAFCPASFHPNFPLSSLFSLYRHHTDRNPLIYTGISFTLGWMATYEPTRVTTPK